MKPLSPALRKAAILISSLDARSADALLDQMGEAQAQRVRAAVMELDDIDPREQEEVIAEFLGGRKPTPASADAYDGLELSGSLAAALQGSPASLSGTSSQPMPAAEATRGSSRPFGFLHDAPTQIVARHLQQEHPQTIAVVLAHLPPPRAAAIVMQLSSSLQTEVLLRIGEMEEMDAEIVREVERGLEAALADELKASRRKGSGVAALEAILQAAGEGRAKLVASVAARDEQLAAQVDRPASATSVPKHQRSPSWAEEWTEPTPAPRRGAVAAPVSVPEEPNSPAIEFVLLGKVDDHGWARILRAADPQTSLLALAGATPELVARLLKQLPPRDARALQRKMEQLGPVRLRDIEHAQQQLARIAALLAARGEIRLPQQRPFATAA